MSVDHQIAPTLSAILHPVSRSSRVGHRRILTDFDSSWEYPSRMAAVSDELQRPGVADALSGVELASLGRVALKAEAEVSSRVLVALRDILARRWTELGTGVVDSALLDPQHGGEVLKAFPDLVASPAFIDGLEGTVEAGLLERIYWRLDLDRLAPATGDQLRRLLPTLDGERARTVRAHLLIAAARPGGWTPWLTLFGLLLHAPALTNDRPPAEPPPAARSFDDEADVAARAAVWAALRDAGPSRAVARLVQDLNEGLARAPTDLWPGYVARLKRATGKDAALRAATIEALLWLGPASNRRLAVYAAQALITQTDLAAIEALIDHPDRRTQHEADQVLSAFRDAPVSTGTMETAREPSGTWIGQAAVERLIETTVATLEEEFARVYPKHHGDGEEKLAERFFSVLGERFRRLTEDLAQTAQANGGTSTSEIEIRYRPVDKPEEGKPGIVRPGQTTPPPKFSADLCLIVEAKLNGAPLARRACLVQAKRLYARNADDPSAGWEASFNLKPEQTDALLAQTESSFYLFQGPGLAGRGLPIIPARLVDELAIEQAPSRQVIASATVGCAAQSFAEWFTYELVALRTGDPLQALLDKADGGPGSTPYDLARFGFGVVEVEVRISEPLKADG